MSEQNNMKFCIDCGKKISRVSTRCRSCSRKGSLNPFYKQKVITQCIICSKTIERYPSQVKKNGNCCSLQCSHILRSKRTKGKRKSLREKPNCLLCGEKLSYYTCKVCQKCAPNHYRTGKKRPEHSKRMKGENNPFYDKTHNEEIRKIISLANGGTGIPREFSEYGIEFDNNLKEQIRFRDKYQCQLCGCPQLENGRQLDVHHIDYNKKNCNSSNLISLCMKCHRKTNFNRSEWPILFSFLKEENLRKCQSQKIQSTLF